MNNITDKCLFLSNHIAKNMEQIIDILCNYETYHTAVDEIARSCRTLCNIEEEISFISNTSVNHVSVYLPLNLPLYSLILFAFVPGLLAKKVFVRPPLAVRKILTELIRIFPNEAFGNISFLDVERRYFNVHYVAKSDVVIFTGKYENTLKVLEFVQNDALFIYNGAGVNPIIVGSNSNIERAVRKGVLARIYNSGQDCAGPDIFFVNVDVWDDFISQLKCELSGLKVGQNNQIGVMVGPLVDQEYRDTIEIYFKENASNIIFGGKIETEKNIVHPTIIKTTIDSAVTNNIEFFAPIFRVAEYKDDSQLLPYFHNENYLNNAMYLSVFGDLSIENELSKKSIILNDCNILDYEIGNRPFGGYGCQSSFIQRNGIRISRPILISKELFNFINA